jgi:signal peptidase I
MSEALKKKSISRKIYIVSLISILIIGVFLGILTMEKLNIKTRIIKGVSMENTLHEGTRNLYISKDFKDIKRQDIVIFKMYYNGEEIEVVKRVIGLPGETILIKGDKVYINGNLLEEPYALYDHLGDDNLEVQIKENEYFVMGDNRYESGDSREYGAILKENILYILIK